jgi:hypothetical protein
VHIVLNRGSPIGLPNTVGLSHIQKAAGFGNADTILR